MFAWRSRRDSVQKISLSVFSHLDPISTREELGRKSLIMDWQSARNKKWIRAIALILIVCFVNQDLVWAQEGSPVWSKGQNGNFALKPQPVTPQGGIAIPKDVAVTKEVYKSTNGGDKTIINIQDAHASLAAQESIVSILDSLVTNYDLKLVAIEGSQGYIDTSILKTFPDEEIRKNTAKYFMKKGKLSAGEFFSITSDHEVALYGIEDKPLYLENVEQFRKIHDINELTRKDIASLTANLNSLKEKAYSKDLMALESNSVLHKDGKISFSDRWELVNTLAARYGISYTRYENLAKLVESLKLEKKINFQKANKERDALIDVLSKKMLKQDLEQLVLKSLSFKMNKISQSEYYIYLQELAQRYGIAPDPYKGLITYTEYISLYESIDLVEIFEEVRKFEDSIKEKLFTNDYQRKLHDFSRFVSLVKDLYELKLTNGDLEELVANKNRVDAASVAGLIREGLSKYGVAIDGGYDLGVIFENIQPALAFYKTAEERNSAILTNTINKMQATGQNVAALVTGGYHTKGLTQLLKQKETSYIVILPKFDSSKGDRPYVAILTNKKEPYEDLLETGEYSLLSDNYLKNSMADPKQAQSFLLDAIITSLGQAAIENRDVESVKKLWLAGYTNAYESLKAKGLISEPSYPPGGETVFALPRPIYRTILKNADGSIENRATAPEEMVKFKERMKRTLAAKGTQSISIEDRLAKVESATKDMLVESITEGMNKNKAKKDFDTEFSRVANRKQFYNGLTGDEKSAVKKSVRGRIDMGDKQLAGTWVIPTPSPRTVEGMLRTVSVHRNTSTEAVVRVGGEPLAVEAAPAQQLLTEPSKPDVIPIIRQIRAIRHALERRIRERDIVAIENLIMRADIAKGAIQEKDSLRKRAYNFKTDDVEVGKREFDRLFALANKARVDFKTELEELRAEPAPAQIPSETMIDAVASRLATDRTAAFYSHFGDGKYITTGSVVKALEAEGVSIDENYQNDRGMMILLNKLIIRLETIRLSEVENEVGLVNELKTEFDKLTDAEVLRKYHEYLVQYAIEGTPRKGRYETSAGSGRAQTPDEFDPPAYADIFGNAIAVYKSYLELYIGAKNDADLDRYAAGIRKYAAQAYVFIKVLTWDDATLERAKSQLAAEDLAAPKTLTQETAMPSARPVVTTKGRNIGAVRIRLIAAICAMAFPALIAIAAITPVIKNLYMATQPPQPSVPAAIAPAPTISGPAVQLEYESKNWTVSRSIVIDFSYNNQFARLVIQETPNGYSINLPQGVELSNEQKKEVLRNYIVTGQHLGEVKTVIEFMLLKGEYVDTDKVKASNGAYIFLQKAAKHIDRRLKKEGPKAKLYQDRSEVTAQLKISEAQYAAALRGEINRLYGFTRICSKVVYADKNADYQEDMAVLLLLTAIHESDKLENRAQDKNGPAKSLFMIQPRSAKTILAWASRDPMQARLLSHAFGVPVGELLALTEPDISKLLENKSNDISSLLLAMLHYKYYMEKTRPEAYPPTRQLLRNNLSRYAGPWVKFYNKGSRPGALNEFTSSISNSIVQQALPEELQLRSEAPSLRTRLAFSTNNLFPFIIGAAGIISLFGQQANAAIAGVFQSPIANNINIPYGIIAWGLVFSLIIYQLYKRNAQEPKQTSAREQILTSPQRKAGSAWISSAILTIYGLPLIISIPSLFIPLFLGQYAIFAYLSLLLIFGGGRMFLFIAYYIIAHMFILLDLDKFTYRVNSKFFSYRIPEGNYSGKWKTQTIQIPIYMEPWPVIRANLESSIEAVRRYNVETGKPIANIMVNDDGLMQLSDNDPLGLEAKIKEKLSNQEKLTKDEIEFHNRMTFYRSHAGEGFSVIARPKHRSQFAWGTFERRGSFKKGSNLNHSYMLSDLVEKAMGQGMSAEQALAVARSSLVAGQSIFANTFVLGTPRIGELALLLDKDSIVPPAGLMQTVKEFIDDPDLAFTQNSIYVTNAETNWFSALLSHGYEVYIKYLFPVEAHYGFPRMFGHNAFVRKEALKQVGYWNENQVGEDTAFSVAVSQTVNPATGNLYFGRFVQYETLNFGECMRLSLEDLEREIKKRGIAEEAIQGFMRHIERAGFDEYLPLYNVRKSVFKAAMNTEGGLTRKIILSLFLHFESLQSFGEAAPESINADLPRKTKFAHGDTEIILNPISQWIKSGILKPATLSFLKNKQIPWYVKFNFLQGMTIPLESFMPFIFLSINIIFFQLFGSAFFLKLHIGGACVTLFLIGTFLILLSSLTMTMRSNDITKKGGLIWNTFKNFIRIQFQGWVYAGIYFYTSLGAGRYLLGKKVVHMPTPIFDEEGDKSIKEIMSRIITGKATVFALALTVLTMNLVGFYSRLEVNHVTLILGMTGFVAGLFGIIGPFVFETAFVANVNAGVRYYYKSILDIRNRVIEFILKGQRQPQRIQLQPFSLRFLLPIVIALSLAFPATTMSGKSHEPEIIPSATQVSGQVTSEELVAKTLAIQEARTGQLPKNFSTPDEFRKHVLTKTLKLYLTGKAREGLTVFDHYKLNGADLTEGARYSQPELYGLLIKGHLAVIAGEIKDTDLPVAKSRQELLEVIRLVNRIRNPETGLLPWVQMTEDGGIRPDPNQLGRVNILDNAFLIGDMLSVVGALSDSNDPTDQKTIQEATRFTSEIKWNKFFNARKGLFAANYYSDNEEGKKNTEPSGNVIYYDQIYSESLLVYLFGSVLGDVSVKWDQMKYNHRLVQENGIYFYAPELKEGALFQFPYYLYFSHDFNGALLQADQHLISASLLSSYRHGYPIPGSPASDPSANEFNYIHGGVQAIAQDGIQENYAAPLNAGLLYAAHPQHTLVPLSGAYQAEGVFGPFGFADAYQMKDVKPESSQWRVSSNDYFLISGLLAPSTQGNIKRAIQGNPAYRGRYGSLQANFGAVYRFKAFPDQADLAMVSNQQIFRAAVHGGDAAEKLQAIEKDDGAIQLSFPFNGEGDFGFHWFKSEAQVSISGLNQVSFDFKAQKGKVPEKIKIEFHEIKDGREQNYYQFYVEIGKYYKNFGNWQTIEVPIPKPNALLGRKLDVLVLVVEGRVNSNQPAFELRPNFTFSASPAKPESPEGKPARGPIPGWLMAGMGFSGLSALFAAPQTASAAFAGVDIVEAMPGMPVSPVSTLYETIGLGFAVALGLIIIAYFSFKIYARIKAAIILAVLLKKPEISEADEEKFVKIGRLAVPVPPGPTPTVPATLEQAIAGLKIVMASPEWALLSNVSKTIVLNYFFNKYKLSLRDQGGINDWQRLVKITGVKPEAIPIWYDAPQLRRLGLTDAKAVMVFMIEREKAAIAREKAKPEFASQETAQLKIELMKVEGQCAAVTEDMAGIGARMQGLDSKGQLYADLMLQYRLKDERLRQLEAGRKAIESIIRKREAGTPWALFKARVRRVLADRLRGIADTFSMPAPRRALTTIVLCTAIAMTFICMVHASISPATLAAHRFAEKTATTMISQATQPAATQSTTQPVATQPTTAPAAQPAAPVTTQPSAPTTAPAPQPSATQTAGKAEIDYYGNRLKQIEEALRENKVKRFATIIEYAFTDYVRNNINLDLATKEDLEKKILIDTIARTFFEELENRKRAAGVLKSEDIIYAIAKAKDRVDVLLKGRPDSEINVVKSIVEVTLREKASALLEELYKETFFSKIRDSIREKLEAIKQFYAARMEELEKSAATAETTAPIYSDLTVDQVFLRSLDTIDHYTVLEEIAKQEGIVLTAQDKVQLAAIMKLGLVGGIQSGGEVSFYLINPAGPVREDIARYRPVWQRLLTNKAIQDLLNKIYSYQTRYVEAYQKKENYVKMRDEFFSQIEAAARRNVKLQYSDAEIERMRNEIENSIRQQDDVMEDVRKDIKKLLRLKPADNITLSSDFTAWRELSKNIISDSTGKMLKDRYGIVETAESMGELLSNVNSQMATLDYNLKRAEKETSVLLRARLLFGSDGAFGSFLALEFRNDKKTDPMTSFNRAFNGILKFENEVKATRIRREQLSRQAREVGGRITTLEKEAATLAEQVARERLKQYTDSRGQLVPVSAATESSRKYSAVLDQLAMERGNLQNISTELQSLNKGLSFVTAKTPDDHEYDIVYCSGESYWVRGEGIPFMKDYGLDLGLFSARDVSKKRFDVALFGQKEVKPYAILVRKSDGNTRVVENEDNIEKLKISGWKFNTAGVGEEFRLDPKHVEMLERAEKLVRPQPVEGHYVSSGLAGDIRKAHEGSPDIAMARNEVSAVKRTLQAKLAEIPEAHKLKSLLKQREKLEKKFYGAFKKDPSEKVLAEFRGKLDDLEASIDVITNALLKNIQSATANKTDRSALDKLFGNRPTLKVEGFDLEAGMPLTIGGKIKITVGKEYYGEVMLLENARKKAENNVVGLENATTTGVIKIAIELRKAKSACNLADARLSKLAAIKSHLEEAIKDNPANKDELQIELQDTKREASELSVNRDRTNSYYLDLATQYKAFLGVASAADLNINEILSLTPEAMHQRITEIMSNRGLFDGTWMDTDRQLVKETAEIMKYMSLEKIGIPVEMMANTSGFFVAAELFSGEKWKSVLLRREDAGALVKKAQLIYDDVGIALYNQKKSTGLAYNATTSNLQLKKDKLVAARNDVKFVSGKDIIDRKTTLQGTLDTLRAQSDALRAEDEEQDMKAVLLHMDLSKQMSDLYAGAADLTREELRQGEPITVSSISEIKSEDANAAINAVMAGRMAKIERDSRLWSPISTTTSFVSGGFGGIGTQPGGPATDSGTPVIHPLSTASSSSSVKPASSSGTSTSGSSTGSGQQSSTGIILNGGLIFSYDLTKLFFGQDAKIAEKQAALAGLNKKEADLSATEKDIRAASDVETANALVVLAEEQKRDRANDVKIANVPYSQEEKGRESIGPADTLREADAFLKICRDALGIAKNNLQTIRRTTNSDVTVTDDLFRDAMPEFAIMLQQRMLDSSSEDASVKAIEVARAIAGLKIKQAWVDRWLPQIRAEVVASMLDMNIGIEARKEILDGGRLEARQIIERLKAKNIDKEKIERVLGAIYKVDSLFTSLERDLKRLESAETELIISMREYRRQRENFLAKRVNWADYRDAIEKLEKASVEYVIARGVYRGSYAITIANLNSYGITKEEISGYEGKRIRSMPKKVKKLVSGEDLKLKRQREAAEELLAERRRVDAQKREEAQRRADEAAANNEIIEKGIKEKMAQVEAETKKATGKEQAVRPVSESLTRAKLDASKEYRNAVAGLLDALNISYGNDRVLNIDDWSNFFKSHEGAHRLNEAEMIEKLKKMIASYGDLTPEQKKSLREIALRDDQVIRWDKHYESGLSMVQRNNLNYSISVEADGRIKGDNKVRINKDDKGYISLTEIGILSYAVTMNMANPQADPKAVINEIIRYERLGEQERRGELTYDGRAFKDYLEWLKRQAIDLDNKEFYKLPPDSALRKLDNNRVRDIIEKTFGDAHYVFGDGTGQGTVGVWNIFRLINTKAQSDKAKDPYKGFENFMRILKDVARQDDVGLERFYEGFTKEKLSKLPNAARLKALMTKAKSLDPVKDYEELVLVNNEIEQELSILREGQIYGNGIYIIKYALEKNPDIFEALTIRDLIPQEIQRILSFIKEHFHFLTTIKPYIQNVYDMKEPFDVTNPDHIGLLTSFYELSRANGWSTAESVYILKRLADAREEARDFIAMLREGNREGVIFTPTPKNEKDFQDIGFLFGYTFSRINSKGGWNNPAYGNMNERIKNMGKIKHAVEGYYIALGEKPGYKITIDKDPDRSGVNVGRIMAWEDYLSARLSNDVNKLERILKIAGNLGSPEHGIKGLQGGLGSTDADFAIEGLRIGIAQDIVNRSGRWELFFDGNGIAKDAISRREVERLINEVRPNVYRSIKDFIKHDPALSKKQNEWHVAGITMAIARDIVTNYKSWQKFFTSDGTIDADKDKAGTPEGDKQKAQRDTNVKQLFGTVIPNLQE
ncbi:MAG: glycosyltransferase family 2 protein, partial [Candidatus Omnitrophota bacterium]|nr:glycosyltransferase family 2 protein [Candidatus Omnitrophota bacterium]